MSKLFLQLGITLIIFTTAIFIKNFEIIQSWFVNPSETYQATNGIITDSRIGHTGIYGGWGFYIFYEYSVGGIKYTNDTIHFGYKASSNKSYAESYVIKYPKGKKVTVYYDVNNPALSVLETNVKWLGLGYQLIIFTLLSILLLYFAWYHKSKEQINNS